jgi:hypothetical protein
MSYRAYCGGLAALVLLLAAPVQAERVKESETGVTFPLERRWGDYEMTCIGTGVREKFTLDVYGACFYVDQKRGSEAFRAFLASPAAGGAYANGRLDKKKLLGSQPFYDWLVTADLPVSIHMTFVRNVSASKIRGQFRKSLLNSMKPTPALERFLALTNEDMKKWGHIIINVLPGGRVVLQYQRKTFEPIASRELARAILKIYFGRKRISGQLKRGLVRDVDRLLK